MYRSETTENNEIVLHYEGAEEVVEQYRQPHPLAKSPRRIAEELFREEMAYRKQRRRRRRRRALLLLALLLACAALYCIAALLFPRYVPHPWEDAEETACTIPRYEGPRTVQLSLSETGTETLSPNEIYNKVNPAVVTVMAEDGPSTNVGTGAICTPDGFIVTNAHVIEGCSSCAVLLADEYYYDAALVGIAPNEDLAVLKIEDQNYEFPTVSFASSRELQIGDTVYAIGNPLGLKLRGSFTGGMISGLDREIRVDGVTLNLMQTDAALNNGNSGGPLINQYAQVVGVNTAKMKSAGNVEGLNLALPMSEALRKINDLIAFGEVTPAPLIGITVAPLVSPSEDGHTGLVIVEPPTPKGGGALAGLKLGDVLLSVDGAELLRNDDLLAVRDLHHVGDVLHFEVCRKGQHFTVELKLQAKPEK